jgi:hypothetical protein
MNTLIFGPEFVLQLFMNWLVIGAPAIGLLLLLLFSLINPLIYPGSTAGSGAFTSVDHVSIGTSNTVYGVLLGLVLGLASGWQKQKDLRQSTA